MFSFTFFKEMFKKRTRIMYNKTSCHGWVKISMSVHQNNKDSFIRTEPCHSASHMIGRAVTDTNGRLEEGVTEENGRLLEVLIKISTAAILIGWALIQSAEWQKKWNGKMSRNPTWETCCENCHHFLRISINIKNVHWQKRYIKGDLLCFLLFQLSLVWNVVIWAWKSARPGWVAL